MNSSFEKKLQLVCASDSIFTILVKVENLFHDMLQHVRIAVDHAESTIHVYQLHTDLELFYCTLSSDEANRADEKVNVYLTFTKGNEMMLHMRMYHEISMKLRLEPELYIRQLI
jgi:hypothetical protein